MNKRQARIEALDTLNYMIFQEIMSPTGFTLNFSEAERKKVQAALEDLRQEFIRRRKKMKFNTHGKASE